MQEQGESVDDFVTFLHSLAADCEYGSLQKKLIRGKIVVGIRNSYLSKRMLLDNNWTLEGAIVS